MTEKLYNEGFQASQDDISSCLATEYGIEPEVLDQIIETLATELIAKVLERGRISQVDFDVFLNRVELSEPGIIHFMTKTSTTIKLFCSFMQTNSFKERLMTTSNPIVFPRHGQAIWDMETGTIDTQIYYADLNPTN